jgi:hypothetical protein
VRLQLVEQPQRPSEEQYQAKLRAAAAFVVAPVSDELNAKAEYARNPVRDFFADADLRAKMNHSRDPFEQKDARAELSKQRAKARAAAPPRSGQRPTVAQWTEHVRERLSRMTEEQRNELLWDSEWYDGLSERAAGIVDELLLEFGEQETRAEEAAALRRDDLLGESEATAALNAELDEGDAWGRRVPARQRRVRARGRDGRGRSWVRR